MRTSKTAGGPTEAVTVVAGDGPIVLGMPHAGTWLPAEVMATLNQRGRLLSDTDWHIDRVYAGLLPTASMVRANFHRYLIDANRDPSGESLYPGLTSTELVPTTDFDGQAIWITPPDAAEIERRRRNWHAHYHAALEAQLQRASERHGVAILFDCHSIRSQVPRLFPGTLPDFNIGTDYGRTCDPRIEATVRRHCEAAEGYTSVCNGRFRGGWSTRHHGRPAQQRHAVQLEIAQSTYMRESPPWDWLDAHAQRLRAVLAPLLMALDTLAPHLRSGCPDRNRRPDRTPALHPDPTDDGDST